ncbi:hypothetical protein Tco_1129282 [Tanacetum coccineum]
MTGVLIPLKVQVDKQVTPDDWREQTVACARKNDDDGKPLPKVVSTKNTDSDSEVEDVVDDHAVFMTSTVLKCCDDSAYGTNSLLEQWKKTKRYDDYEPYDDYLYESELDGASIANVEPSGNVLTPLAGTPSHRELQSWCPETQVDLHDLNKASPHIFGSFTMNDIFHDVIGQT